MYCCDPGESQPPPIGRPVANTRLYVLDRYLQPVPPGVPGELHVAGISLARGYLNRPELTRAKFIPDPFSAAPGARLYRTGDLVRYRQDGNLEFIGRIDQQVKVRGFRIELGEIETIMGGHPQVEQAAVVAQEPFPGEKRLVAYVVIRDPLLEIGEKEEPAELPTFQPSEDTESAIRADQSPITIHQSRITHDLRQYLRRFLPDYMLPAAFVYLDRLPLSPSGKVDRNALPAAECVRPELEHEFVAPRNEVETLLAGMCAGLLGIDRVGAFDNFFELGGHSLLATQFISRIREAFEVELPLRVLFEHPTSAELAAVLELEQARQAQAPAPAIQARSREVYRRKRSTLRPDGGGGSPDRTVAEKQSV
jgi:hypothetical protein